MLVVPSGCWLVALRKESVDRNALLLGTVITYNVALRKESVDRNVQIIMSGYARERSLSARRAWIEMGAGGAAPRVATSLSARRAWIEITQRRDFKRLGLLVALRKESVDRNIIKITRVHPHGGVALRKESVDRNSE